MKVAPADILEPVAKLKEGLDRHAIGAKGRGQVIEIARVLFQHSEAGLVPAGSRGAKRRHELGDDGAPVAGHRRHQRREAQRVDVVEPAECKRSDSAIPSLGPTDDQKTQSGFARGVFDAKELEFLVRRKGGIGEQPKPKPAVEEAFGFDRLEQGVVARGQIVEVMIDLDLHAWTLRGPGRNLGGPLDSV